MKKALFMTLMATMIMMSPMKDVDAKTLLIPDTKLTESYLKEHQEDDIYVYFYGKTTDNKGNGQVSMYGMPGYVSYKHIKCKKGTKFTTILKMTKGTLSIDDAEDRIDYKGWSKPVVK